MAKFSYKCPLCGEISEYETLDENIMEIAKEPDTIMFFKCMICNRTWAKYAYVIFGRDK